MIKSIKDFKEEGIFMEKIYTIPVNDAFNVQDGCPFCRMYKTLEDNELDIILGASMMEPDIRIETNKLGFCREHYEKMFGMKNRLSLALMLESHLDELIKGVSGGGLFNAKGQLIGIVNAKLKQSSVENIGYSIPSNVAIGIAQNIIDNCDGKANKSVIKCLVGITVFTTDTRAEYNEDGTITLYDTIEIQSLTETSIAKDVLKAGDILYKVKISDNDEHTICRQFELIDMLLDARIGDTVTITVLREGKEVSFTGKFTDDTVSLVP